MEIQRVLYTRHKWCRAYLCNWPVWMYYRRYGHTRVVTKRWMSVSNSASCPLSCKSTPRDQCFVSGVVERRPAPRRGFRGECFPPTTLHRLCGQRNDKLSGWRRWWRFINGLRKTKTQQFAREILAEGTIMGMPVTMGPWITTTDTYARVASWNDGVIT